MAEPTRQVPPADPTTQDQPESPGSDDPDSSPQDPSDAPTRSKIVVNVLNNTPNPEPAPQGWLHDLLLRAAELCDIGEANLTLVVVDDAEMAQLHERYTGVAGTTDVLTFDMRTEGLGDGEALEGDIIVCLDEAKRQAKKRGHPTHHELVLYAVHGLLHLLGEDDHDEGDYLRMHTREDELLKKLGLGPLFNPDSQTP